MEINTEIPTIEELSQESFINSAVLNVTKSGFTHCSTLEVLLHSMVTL